MTTTAIRPRPRSRCRCVRGTTVPTWRLGVQFDAVRAAGLILRCPVPGHRQEILAPRLARALALFDGDVTTVTR